MSVGMQNSGLKKGYDNVAIPKYTAPTPAAYQSPLDAIMPGVSDIMNKYTSAYNTEDAYQAQQLRDQVERNLSNSGIAASPTGSQIMGDSEARRAAMSGAQYGNSMLGVGTQLSALEAAAQAQQRQIAASQAMAYQQQVTDPLAFQQQQQPLNMDDYRQSVLLYRQLFPNWNSNPLGQLQGLQGGSSSLSGGTSDPNNLPPWDHGGVTKPGTASPGSPLPPGVTTSVGPQQQQSGGWNFPMPAGGAITGGAGSLGTGASQYWDSGN